MRGDYSRITFRPDRHYSGVLQQQGRVSLDADFNEHEEIERYRLRQLARDVIGACGGPRDDAGFDITVDGSGQITFGAGRYYVDGLLVENEAPAAVRLPDSAPGRYLAYLDVWEAEVTSLDDPSLTDPALGGPDTTVRLQVVWRVHISPCAPDGDLTTDEERPTLDVSTGADGYAGAENALYRIEIHSADKEGEPSFKWSRDNGSLVLPLSDIHGDTVVVSDAAGLSTSDWLELLDASLELEGLPGQLAQIAAIDIGKQSVQLSEPVVANLSDRPRVRRWHGAGQAGQSVALEEGIELQFGGSGFKSGDYWTFAARPANRSVEWPGGPQPASRVEHRICPLAVLKRTNKGKWQVVEDRRALFRPLAS